MKQEDYWNSNLDTDNLSRRGGQFHTRLKESLALARTPEFEWLRKRLGDMRERVVIDVGGGIGMHALIWAHEGAQVVVVDLAERRLAALRELALEADVADRIVFVRGRGERLPFRDESADAVFTKSVLIHTDLPIAAGEIHRVLKPGGHGAFIEPLNRNPLIRFYRRVFAPKIWRSITRYFDREALDDLRRPFGRLRWKPFYLLSAWSFFWQYVWKNPERFWRSLEKWRRIDARLMRRWPVLSSWCWFAAIEVRKEESRTDSSPGVVSEEEALSNDSEIHK